MPNQQRLSPFINSSFLLIKLRRCRLGFSDRERDVLKAGGKLAAIRDKQAKK